MVVHPAAGHAIAMARPPGLHRRRMRGPARRTGARARACPLLFRTAAWISHRVVRVPGRVV